jgi:hypothetical protein
VASIRQNTITDNIKYLLNPEQWYAVKDEPARHAIESSHEGDFVFYYGGRMRFVFMLVKTAEYYFHLQSPGFKAICQQLNVDLWFPLLLVTGVFESHAPGLPPTLDVYRRWLASTLLLGMPKNEHWPDITSYALDKRISIQVQGGEGTPWYEKATFTIRQLTDISDIHEVEKVVAELLKL